MYRSLPLNIILTIVTCGLYGLYWFVVLTDEVNRLSGRRNDTSGGMALLFTIITCGIYGIYWAYKLGEKMSLIKTLYYGQPSSDAILYTVFQIIGLPIITYALVQNEINCIIEGRGGYYPNSGDFNNGANNYNNGYNNGYNNNYNNSFTNQNMGNQNSYGQNMGNQNMKGQGMANQNMTDHNNGEVEDYGDE